MVRLSADKGGRGYVSAALAGMGLSRAEYVRLVQRLGDPGEARTISQRLRRWDAGEVPILGEAVALLALLGRVRGALADVCGPVAQRRR